MKTVIRPRPITLLFLGTIVACAQKGAEAPKQDLNVKKIVYTPQEEQLLAKVRALSDTPYEFRGMLANPLALDIRHLPPSSNKLRLADALAFVSTAGDLGHDTLQEIATTLAEALHEQPGKSDPAYLDQLDTAYLNLARLVDYEYVKAPLDDPKLAAVLKRLEADDQHRREVDFSLKDLNGKSWSLKDLRGKVVVVNFWATWSKPCWQEVTDLKELSQRFKKQDLVVLAIFGEKSDRVTNFVKSQKITFPVLLDPEQKVTNLYRIAGGGFPKSFVYNREGDLIAQAIDMRTRKQFLSILSQAGLQ